MPVGDDAMSYDDCLRLCLESCIEARVAWHCEGFMCREIALGLRTFSASVSANMTDSIQLAKCIDYRSLPEHRNAQRAQ